jgi:hypothetical protein
MGKGLVVRDQMGGRGLAFAQQLPPSARCGAGQTGGRSGHIPWIPIHEFADYEDRLPSPRV